MIPKRLRRSSAFRLATTLSAVFCLAIGLIMAMVYLRTGAQLRRNLDLGAQAELAELMTDWSQGGLDSVQRAMRAEVAPGGSDDTFYLLQDHGGTVLGGNLTRGIAPILGPSLVPRTQLRLDIDPDRIDDVGDSFHVAATMLGDYYVAVGQSDADVREILNSMLKVFSAGLAVTVAVCVAVGLYLSRRMHRRIEGIRAALVRVGDGDLSGAIPGRTPHDDVGEVVVLINQTVAALRRVVEAMQQLSNDVTHDLKRPLARLRQQLSLAQDSARQGLDVMPHVGQAEHQARSMQSIFEALLRLSHIESGVRRARLGEFNLTALLADLQQTFEPVANEAGHSLSAELGAGAAVIRGDQELLTQCFVNLIENAICHTPAGTHIRIRLSVEGSAVVASVVDDGPGIPEQERGLVTRRFYRLERSRTSDGHGLGLSLVSAVAALHDASLEIADAAPGLRVTLRFALAGAAQL